MFVPRYTQARQNSGDFSLHPQWCKLVLSLSLCLLDNSEGNLGQTCDKYFSSGVIVIKEICPSVLLCPTLEKDLRVLGKKAMWIFGKSILGKRNSNCKGPGALGGTKRRRWVDYRGVCGRNKDWRKKPFGGASEVHCDRTDFDTMWSPCEATSLQC